MTLLQQCRLLAVSLLWRCSARFGWVTLVCLCVGWATLAYWQWQQQTLQFQIAEMQVQLAEQVARGGDHASATVSTTSNGRSAPSSRSISSTDNQTAEVSLLTETERRQRFMAQLPVSSQLPVTLKQMAQLAVAQQLALNVGDYQWQEVPSGGDTFGLRTVEMRFVVHAPYGSIKRWVVEVLNRYPLVALSSMEFKRNEISEPQLEATLVFTAYFKQAVNHASQ